MRFFPAIFLLGAISVFAQASNPDITRAQAELEKLRGLVAAGAVPRAQLEQAEEKLDDARDSAVLRRTLYGQDLTADQSDEMIAAATRRFERRKAAYDKAQQLVAAGVAPEASLEASLQDLDMARKECDLAESRAKLTAELHAMARTEETLANKLTEAPEEAHKIAERYDGNGMFTPTTFNRVEFAFEHKFGKPLPVSAMGETAVHRALGFDHRGRVDVALSPDQPEGTWLREYLTENHIPYFAFRQAVPGKATGAHIHLGPMSTRLKAGG